MSARMIVALLMEGVVVMAEGGGEVDDWGRAEAGERR